MSEEDEKEVILLQIEEGKDKPYTIRDKEPYIRAGATDRIVTRYELDEFYTQKRIRSGYPY